MDCAIQHTVCWSQAQVNWEGCGTKGIWRKALGGMLGSLSFISVAAASPLAVIQ